MVPRAGGLHFSQGREDGADVVVTLLGNFVAKGPNLVDDGIWSASWAASSSGVQITGGWQQARKPSASF
jgi:hypothetical protein